jgi:poly(3-hydroxybutyrate) depolymerase
MAVMLGSRSRSLLLAFMGCLVAAGQAQAQDSQASLAAGQPKAQGEFVNRVLTDANGDHKYVVFVPANYSADKKWPVILFLHGACNRGTDGRSQLVSGMAPSIRLRLEEYPFLVVFPQCEDTQSRVLGGWTDQPEDSERALKMLDAVENDYSVDKKRECLVGLSMGGSGAWKVAARTKDRWAALVPVSAMADPADAPLVAGIPTWVFHASSDPLVAPHIATDMVAAVNAAGGKAHFTEVTKRAHDLSNVVFTQTALTDWMLDPTKEPKQDLAWVEPKGYNNGHESELPFIPGAEMPRAVRFRVCKDVLEALCFSAPEKLASKPVTGYVGGVYQSAKVGGFLPIDVALQGLHYSGHVERLRIVPMAPNRLVMQVGLRNLTMTVSNSQLNGKLLLSATAGAMNVVIGHRAPVWLTIECRPTVIDRKVQLNLTGMDFQIPNDNWYVTEPNGVHVRGLPFLNGKVSDGLVGGIYNKKGEFERQVMNSVPGMIQNFEKKLNEVIFNRITCVGQIAMPIWQPRMKTYPEEVIIDNDGVTIVSGVILGTLGQVPKDFKMKTYPAPTEFPPVIKNGLEIDVAETVVPAWSQLIMTGRVNRFNVFDFTPKEYHALADREFLQEMIPDLKKFGEDVEMNVDFLLRDPIHLLDPKPSTGPKLLDQPPGNPLTLSLTSVPLNISMRRKGETRWTPVGELDLSITRDYAPYVKKNGFVRRGPKFAEIGEFDIKSKWSFAPGYAAENTHVEEAKFTAAVLKAREAARLLEGVKPDAVHDVVMNGVPLRMDAMDWSKKHLVVQYQLPGVMVSNDSGEAVTYEVKGPYTDWSKSRTLAPGDFDEYRVPYALTWRRRSDAEVQYYTLPMGKEISYRIDPKPGMVLVNHAEEFQEERIVPQK